ncbi:MAG TPA: YeeE/YedE thiosulfate transporter family protein, partial [Beijerinckiaceae bacterium]|nr:YeeE/YedE thiosulfate transporter family protein [Beijerinckiaceae bacterium]
GVTAGWAATGVLVDPFHPSIRLQSLTFVAPVGRAFYGAMMGGPNWLDFGVATVPGVIAGAFLASWAGNELRWEAFDDPREMRRHVLGAAMMGIGGVLAGGCTIGQGLTAASLTAATAPLAIAGFMLGARIGILFLVESSLRDMLAHLFARR